MRTKSETLWDKFWKDDQGRIVVWQTPNAFLIGWVILTLISLFLNGTVSDVFSWASIVSIVIWSVLEIFKGVNYFRRAFGTVVMVLIILAIVHIV